MNDQPMCFACHQPIADVVVWLGETYDGEEKEWPFHEICADRPWPLYETRRETIPEPGANRSGQA